MNLTQISLYLNSAIFFFVNFSSRILSFQTVCPNWVSFPMTTVATSNIFDHFCEFTSTVSPLTSALFMIATAGGLCVGCRNNNNQQANVKDCEVLSGIFGGTGDGPHFVRFCSGFQWYAINFIAISVARHKFHRDFNGTP